MLGLPALPEPTSLPSLEEVLALPISPGGTLSTVIPSGPAFPSAPPRLAAAPLLSSHNILHLNLFPLSPASSLVVPPSPDALPDKVLSARTLFPHHDSLPSATDNHSDNSARFSPLFSFG
eukprot:TRINITY_DN6729_c0_g1_i6.p3 TRINITY_DN6729_c0_g1~~TRINITY_DN6729_c0_g1_i6.p3  ORF type:complete len:120 (+),score=38.22 TRINITY_DN6729_c0_g1_i6:294-653(+)